MGICHVVLVDVSKCTGVVIRDWLLSISVEFGIDAI
jgi:hypothetical protein